MKIKIIIILLFKKKAEEKRRKKTISLDKILKYNIFYFKNYVKNNFFFLTGAQYYKLFRGFFL
jgi:hypothetical protein